MSGLLLQSRDQNLVMPARELARSPSEQWLKLAHRFSEVQYRAYQERLDLQPNGKSLKAQLSKLETTPQAKLMRLSIGIQILEQLTAMGQDLLHFLRHFGTQLLNADKLSLGKNPEFEKNFLSSLSDSNGNALSLSPILTLQLASLFHQAWKNSLQDPAMADHQSLTASLYSKNRSDWLNIVNLRPETINCDCLTVFFLCKQLAKIPEAEFREMLLISAPDNPQDLDLKYAIGKEGLTLGRRSDKIHLHLPNSRSISNPLDLPEANVRARDCDLIDRALLRFRQKLEDYEDTQLLPAVLSGIQKDTFFETCQSLSDLRTLRDQYIMAVSLSADFIFSRAPESLSNQDIVCLLKKLAPDGISELITELEERYLQSAAKMIHSGTNPNIRLISNIESFLGYETEIKSIIDSVTTDLKDPAFRSNGGIIENYYDSSFWQEFFNSSGRILLSTDNNKVVGFFLYYLPGNLPEQYTPEQFTKSVNNAYAELAITTPDRPKGTYRQMTQAMLAALQLSTAEYLDFVVYDTNQRSQLAQLASGFFPRLARSIVLDNLPENSQANFIPYRLPVSPSALKALQPLQKRVSELFKERLGDS